MFILHINNKALNKDNLLSALSFNSSPEEMFVIEFCQQWLSNQLTFTVPTSGSTGKPKHIEISRNQILASIKGTQRAFELKEGDTCLLNLSAKHIAGKMMLARAMEIGMEITFVTPSSNPIESINASFDFYAFVPLQLQSMFNHSPEKIRTLNQAKAIIIGGAKISLELDKNIQQIQSPVYATYGMTETVSHIAIKRLNGSEKANCFQTLPNVYVALDVRGCLKTKAPVTNNQWLQTNDLAVLHNCGFELMGRIDNVINTGGLKVQAEKVEANVEAFFLNNGIQNRFFIAGLPHSYFGEQVTLFIEGEFKLKDSLLNQLNQQLEKHEIPKEVISISNFSETESGKLDKKKTVGFLT